MIGTMSLDNLARQLDGELLGNDVSFRELSTDTRSLASGQAYLALVGEHFNGNEFVGQAQARGAVAAIVSESQPADLPQLLVANTHDALARIARENRLRSNAKVVALTGSQGKTSVKEMLAAIFSDAAETLATSANLNNTIGVPLTLLRLESRHRFAVIEMGANRAGEIAFSVASTLPDVALITGASAAHIEGFGSLQGIVTAKGEILESFHGPGTAVLNADDVHVEQWITRSGDHNVVLFSYADDSGRSSYYAQQVVFGGDGRVAFDLHTPLGVSSIELKMLGKHNIVNAVAAAAAAIEAGATLENVRAGLSVIEPVPGRMAPVTGYKESLLIDDSYNASPGSFFAAIDVLVSCRGKKILVMGDMRELGAESAASHRAVGDYARQAGVELLLAVGEESRQAIAAFGPQGVWFAEQQQLIDACRELANDQVTFLVKGSRGARMDIVVNALDNGGHH